MNVSTYLMEHGSVLKDGDTIGTDSSAIMRVRHKQAADGRLALVLERNAELT